MEITVTKPEGPFEMSGNRWDSEKEELKKNHSELTNEDLCFDSGKENELLERIRTRLDENLTEGHYMVYFCG
jgi:hypothetical protein